MSCFCATFFCRACAEGKAVSFRLRHLYRAAERQEVSQDWFAPGWTEYASRLQYQVYDVTALIQPENTLEITTANGWYAGYLNGTRQVYGKQTAIFAELSLTCMDSHRVTVAPMCAGSGTLGSTRGGVLPR